MNLSQISLKLKQENIQSFINDFVKVDGVYIGDIELKKDIIIIKKIKYKSFGSLSVGLSIARIEDGVISIGLRKLKAINLPITVMPINFIVKIVLSKIDIQGISSDGKEIKVEIKKVLSQFNADFVDLEIKKLEINQGEIEVIVDNFDLNMIDLMSKSVKLQENKDNNEVVKNTLLLEDSKQKEYENIYEESYKTQKPFEKNEKGYLGCYGNFRENISNNKLKDKKILERVLFMLPDLIILAYRLLRDKRVKKGLKVLITSTIVYLISPIDIIKDKVKILGKMDEVLFIVFTMNKVFTSVDRDILKYHFDGDDETLDFLIDSFDILNGFLGGEKINKLYTVFEKFVR